MPPAKKTSRVSAIERTLTDTARQTTVTLGGKTCFIGQNVFAPWRDEREDETVERWYAGRVFGVFDNKFVVVWAEKKNEETFCSPESLFLAVDVLRPHSTVNLPDQRENGEGNCFYQEHVVVRYRENGPCSVRGKKGMIRLRNFDEMMLETRDFLSNKPTELSELSESSERLGRSSLLAGHCIVTMFGEGTRVMGTRVMGPAALSHLVKKLGGKEVTSLEELIEWRQSPEVNPRLSFLVAEKAVQTELFMFCLAANIPCVSSEWLVELQKSKIYVNYENHRLMAGHPLPSGREPTIKNVIWTPRKTLLNNLRIGFFENVFYENGTFLANLIFSKKLFEKWFAVIKVGKGEAMFFTVDHFDAIDEKLLDVVLVEKTAPVDLIAKCREALVPLVTEEWLVNTLIFGKKRPFALYRPKPT